MSTPNQANIAARTLLLQQALKERILILDGAMGTMVQTYGLEEADYRGERFKNVHHDVKGNNDLLVLSKPEVIREIHQAYLDAGADIILLDNMGLDDLRTAAAWCRGRALTEASGGVTLERLPAIAATGVDFISSGALTHAARWVDIGLDFDP